MSDLSDLVARSLHPDTRETFDERVDEQAAFLREEVREGRLDNDQFAIGLEMEVYAAEAVAEGPQLTRLPADLFEHGAVTKELGLHNAEINTDPSVFDAEGLAEQAATIRSQTAAAKDAAAETGADLLLDAMWTVPPSEGTSAYLSASEDDDGVAVASNMRPAPRYVAIDEAIREHAGGDLTLTVPGAELSFPSILFESLATSIQPHLQIPDTESFPEYYNAGIRTLGPLLALATNSPFLPGDLYEDVTDPGSVVDATHHELRIAVFEQSVNYTGNPKVRVPEDIDSMDDVVAGVVGDDVVAPFLREWLQNGPAEAYTDNYWEFEHKRGTYWRWLRCVVGGDPVGTGDERSVRIEYRPLPTQPTVTDVVGLQALTAGLLRGLVVEDHPLAELPWEAAERSFYAAAESGLDADLAWMTAEGERTDDSDVIFAEVFEYAERGLEAQGVDSEAAAAYLQPIRARWEAGTVPSDWKKAQVRDRLAAGDDLETAITGMQREYARLSRETESFAEWI
jgi:hypothetical protein